MGLEASLFSQDTSPYRQAALKSFLGSRLGTPKRQQDQTPDVFQLSKPQNAQSFNGMGGSLADLSPLPSQAAHASPVASLFSSNSTPLSVPNPTGIAGDVEGTTFEGDVYDPILAQIRAARVADIAQAENNALAGKRQALGAFGDRALAEKELGAGDPTLGSISDNPDTSESTLARIARSYRSAVKSNEDAMNEANLFYGGYRGTRLKDLSQQRTDQESDASKALQETLQQIGQALLEKKNQARDADLMDRENAFREALLRAGSRGSSSGSSTSGDDKGGDLGGPFYNGIDGTTTNVAQLGEGDHTMSDGAVIHVNRDGSYYTITPAQNPALAPDLLERRLARG